MDTSSIRSIFAARVAEWARAVSQLAPERVLAEALAHATTPGVLLHILAQVGVDQEVSEVARLREAALARGLAERQRLREAAGGFRDTSWVSEHLGITRQAIDKRRKSGKLLAFEAVDGSYEYPLAQFTEDGVVPGLDRALELMAGLGSWEQLSALVNPSPALSGRAVIDVLCDLDDPEREQALAAAREFLR